MAELRMHKPMLGNFKDKARRHRKEPPRRSERPGMSDAHLKMIRQLPCTRCGSPAPSDPHHLKSELSHERGMGRRAPDRYTVPLCRGCHDDLERSGTRRERGWFESFGVVPHYLAEGLWRNTGDLDRMRRVLQAHREQT